MGEIMFGNDEDHNEAFMPWLKSLVAQEYNNGIEKLMPNTTSTLATMVST